MGLSHCGALGVPQPSSPAVPSTPRRRLATPQLEAHAHLFSPHLADVLRRLLGDRFLTADIKSTNRKQLLERLDQAGIQRAFVLSTAYINAADTTPFGIPDGSAEEHRRVQEENDFTADEAAMAGARLIRSEASIRNATTRSRS
jgi:hypothetical protein